MANIIEDILWEEGIYQLEMSDLVLGGEDGVSNVQAKQLANRTSWLKDKVGLIDHFDDLLEVVANTAIGNSIAGKAVVVNANNATIEITLGALESFRNGAIIPICAFNVNKSSVAVTANEDDKILYMGVDYQTVYMEEGEQIWLVAKGSKWQLFPFHYLLKHVGEVLYAYTVLPGTIPLHGQPVNRRDIARISDYALSGGMANSIVTDVLWNSTINNRGFFSTGNGTTTIRMPDLRDMTIRGLSSGRGISLNRSSPNSGGYEGDQNKSHTHPYRDKYLSGGGPASDADYKDAHPPAYNQKMGSTITKNVASYWLVYDSNTGSTGGTEVTVKNIGLIPLMRK
ncbi:MAG: hypothetical protein M9904_02380 [Chitinophagaceae bacterium]|nr:hypothetical protein [Chitinophagaceae bacterium]